MTTFTIILSLLSGVALFLFGMSLMGDGLKKVAGNKLELVLYKLTNTPLKGVLLGTCLLYTSFENFVDFEQLKEDYDEFRNYLLKYQSEKERIWHQNSTR